jgi:hypothetical protein
MPEQTIGDFIPEKGEQGQYRDNPKPKTRSVQSQETDTYMQQKQKGPTAMKTRTSIGVLLLTVIISHIIGYSNNYTLLISFIPVTLLALFLAIVVTTVNLLLRFTPDENRKSRTPSKRQLRIFILTGFLFLVFGGWIINHYCLPLIPHPVSLLGNAGILCFMIFFEWALIRKKSKHVLLAGMIIFPLFIVILAVSKSITYRQYSGSISTIEILKTLPYVNTSPVPDEEAGEEGVTKYDPNEAFDGINLYCIGVFGRAFLMDMSGERLHSWVLKPQVWHEAKLSKNGDLLGGAYDGTFARLDWDSNIKWAKKMSFHHDLAFDEKENIYALDRKDEAVFRLPLPIPVVNDYIVIFGPDGTVKRNISLFNVLRKDIPFDRVIKIYSEIIKPVNLYKFAKANLGNLYALIRNKSISDIKLGNDTPFDLIHNNTVTIIDRDINGLCKKADLLISARDLDLIGILDARNEKLIWRWGPGELSRQHQPTLLENGNILVFDNGRIREYSRVIELDPLTKKIVWEYKANPANNFYSPTRGGCQKLPNGNILISDNGKGRFFEITKEGRVVWEYKSPLLSKDKRASIHRMMRITNPNEYPKLKSLRSKRLRI